MIKFLENLQWMLDFSQELLSAFILKYPVLSGS